MRMSNLIHSLFLDQILELLELVLLSNKHINQKIHAMIMIPGRDLGMSTKLIIETMLLLWFSHLLRMGFNSEIKMNSAKNTIKAILNTLDFDDMINIIIFSDTA